MVDLLSQLSGVSKSKPVEPREIFMSLPTKDKSYEYPRDVQSEVWKKWFEKRNSKNTILKMNTGSGKTVVGLTILQSCLNEGKGPAIYVVPDNYLVVQVCEEATRLGIMAVTDRNDYHYTEKKAILVMPVHTLVNGKSVFGMRPTDNYPIGSILLDDVHACLDRITSQSSLKILSSHELYKKIILAIADQWKAYEGNAYTNIIEMKDPQKSALLPFWIWQSKQDELYRLLKEYDNDAKENQFVFFTLPLLLDCLPFCNCVITAHSIEITPKATPISKISSFENASRRIFMSATLADDGVFVSAIGLKEKEIKDIITPDKANDIGDRLILFPKHLNGNLSDEEIRDKILSYTSKYNVVVIVPSYERGRFWDETGQRLVDKDNIESAVSALRDQHVGLIVLISRYDGIDLPDDACRILVLDGLPPLRSAYDKYAHSINPTNDSILRERIQRIEQGMGRGVRSNSDSCCVILMGNKLADVLLRSNGDIYFSNATTEQYNLSKELWDLLKRENKNPSIDDMFELLNYSLNREVFWIEKSKERLSAITYKTTPSIAPTVEALREAFDQAGIGQWQKASAAIDSVIRVETDEKTKGYLMQIKAEFTNFFDCSQAQQILLRARTLNAGTLIPINGILYDKIVNRKEQARAVLEYLSKVSSNSNDCIIHINAVFDQLRFSPNANEFESAFQEVGHMLGFASSRPDKETFGKGPDNLWAMGNGEYLVVECKSGAVVDAISKDYCNQLGGSMRWFDNEYGEECSYVPVMVHRSVYIDTAATPPSGMRVITIEHLARIKVQLNSLFVAIAQPENWGNDAAISSLLSQYKLRRQDIVSEYTSPCIRM